MFELTYQDATLFHYKKGKPYILPEPLAPLADTHTHVTSFEALNPALAIARAQAAGVGLMVVPIDPVCDQMDAPQLNELDTNWRLAAEKELHSLKDAQVSVHNSSLIQDGIKYLAGVHPYGAQDWCDHTLHTLENFLCNKNVVGIGEIGLDYNSNVDHDIQKLAFRQQLALAREQNIPVELHLRNAKDDQLCMCHRDAYDILQRDGFPSAGCILHCFTQTADIMHLFCDLGCYIAFGGASTFASAPYIRQALVEVPEHLMLSETDAPYMAPVPLRGQECEAAMIALIVAHIANIRNDAWGIPKKETYQRLWDNACSIFC